MDVQRFHLKLLGQNQNNGQVPQEYRLNDTYTALYAAYDRGIHGYSQADTNEALFTATFVLALCLTEVINPTYVVVPKQHVRWIFDQMERVGRYIFRCRKGDKDGALVLRKAFKQIRVTHKPFEFAEAPDRWVMFGFTNTDPMPPWAQNRLLDLGELQVPLAGAPTTTAA